MGNTYGQRIQDLKRFISAGFEQLGIIGVRFYVNENPRVEYKVNEELDRKQCALLKSSIERVLTSNHPELLGIEWLKDDSKRLYIARFNFVPDFQLKENSTELLTILSHAYHEIQGHIRK